MASNEASKADKGQITEDPVGLAETGLFFFLVDKKTLYGRCAGTWKED